MSHNIPPSISVIIPTLNAGECIERAIQSVLIQNHPAVELIIIDGGSVDEEYRRIQKYKDSIHYFSSEKDRGVYSAINKGIRVSSGEWIYILGSDDMLAASDTLSQMLSTTNQDAKLIYGNVRNINKNHRLVPSLFVSRFGQGLLWRNTLHQQGVLYHKSLFESDEFNENRKVLADYEMHLKLFINKTMAISCPVTVAISNATGLSKCFTLELYKEELDIKRHLLTTPLYCINFIWTLIKYITKKTMAFKL